MQGTYTQSSDEEDGHGENGNSSPLLSNDNDHNSSFNRVDADSFQQDKTNLSQNVECSTDNHDDEKKEEESIALRKSGTIKTTNATKNSKLESSQEEYDDEEQLQSKVDQEEQEEQEARKEAAEEDGGSEKQKREQERLTHPMTVTPAPHGRRFSLDSHISSTPSFRMTPVKLAATHPLIQNLNKNNNEQNQKNDQLMFQCCPRSIVSAGLPIFIAIFIVFLVLAGDKGDDGSNNGAGDRETDPLWQMLKNVSGIDVSNRSTDRGRAAHWVLVDDSFLTSDPNTTTTAEKGLSPQDRILQRYLLALLYHSTTRQNSTWRFCGAPTSSSSSDATSCRFSVLHTAILSHDKEHDDGEEEQRTNQMAHSTSWLSRGTDECTWFGIECDSHGQVARIQLENNHMRGTLPPELHLLSELQLLVLADNSVSGTIPALVLALPQLQVLDLSFNDLTGTLPMDDLPFLSSLSSLQVLRLTGNSLQGQLLPWLGQPGLQNLTVLQLGYNAFTGFIPTALGQMHRLEILGLHHNQLQGSIPSELTSLQRLQVLSLQENPNMGGTIPGSLGDLTRLRDLYLGGLGLSGEIPPSLYQLEQLEQWHANNNTLTGSLSESVGNLLHLRQLDLSHNHLTGNIPASLAQLPNLEVAWLHSNALQGTMPLSVCQVVEETDSQLQTLSSDCTMGNDNIDNDALVSCSCCTMCCHAESQKCQSKRDLP